MLESAYQVCIDHERNVEKVNTVLRRNRGFIIDSKWNFEMQIMPIGLIYDFGRVQGCLINCKACGKW